MFINTTIHTMPHGEKMITNKKIAAPKDTGNGEQKPFLERLIDPKNLSLDNAQSRISLYVELNKHASSETDPYLFYKILTTEKEKLETIAKRAKKSREPTSNVNNDWILRDVFPPHVLHKDGKTKIIHADHEDHPSHSKNIERGGVGAVHPPSDRERRIRKLREENPGIHLDSHLDIEF